MTKLGTSLAFYFKYPNEMEHLYFEPKAKKMKKVPAIKGWKDEIRDMIVRVGEASCREAAAFLEVCAARIQPHFESIGIAHRIRNSPGRSWEVKWRLAPKKQPNQDFHIGVFIDEAIVPWIWCRGGSRAIADVASFLRRSGHKVEGDTTRFITLARIKVSCDASRGFDVDREPLVESVYKALTLDVAHVKAIAEIARRRND